jgi:hypothetical protein
VVLNLCDGVHKNVPTPLNEHVNPYEPTPAINAIPVDPAAPIDIVGPYTSSIVAPPLEKLIVNPVGLEMVKL